MTIQNVFFKEHEGLVPNPTNGPLSNGPPRWCGLGPPAYGANFVQSKLTFLELSAGGNQISVAEEPENQQGDCTRAENGVKTLQSFSLDQAPTMEIMEYQGHFNLGFGQPLICGQYPYAEQYPYGVLYSTYGTQIPSRIMLPLNISSDGGPIYVNAKQYNRIMIRRNSRAKAEMENQVIKSRKPYQHFSRHLHAMRRPRGSGGRFLNTKNSNTNSQKTKDKKSDRKEKHLPRPTESQVSEVLQYDDQRIINSKGIPTTADNRSTSPGSEVTSHDLFSTVDPFPYNNHLHRSFQSFQSMAAENYLKI